MMRALRSDRVGRVVAFWVAIASVCFGLRPLLRGDLFYSNYWGGLVLGPLAIVIGLFALYLVLFRWKELSEKAAAKRRLRGRAARKARQADRHRAPIDDFERPWTGGM